MDGALGRARETFRHRNFRWLLATRLLSQGSDGLFQAVLVASVVFTPEKQSTAAGFAKAVALLFVPFSLIGPFTGVFIDRWSRRRILVLTPLIRAGFALLVLAGVGASYPFYAGALAVLSLNRFFLSTASAVMPRLVPDEELLVANSLATVGGTVATFVGIFVGGQLAGAIGDRWLVLASAAAWLTTALLASGIAGALSAPRPPEERLRRELGRALRDFADGIGRLARTPRALGPITAISVDQFVQGFILVLSLVVFRERFKAGVGSYSWIVGASGAGILVGLLTVGSLGERMRKTSIVSMSFGISGAALLLVAPAIGRITIPAAGFALGLCFAWKKVPVDTMVQEAVADVYRGRVFAVYDVGYNMSRVLAALVAIPLIPALGDAWSLALSGIVFLLFSPVLSLWLRRVPELAVRFYSGGRAEESPRAIVRGGLEEPVDVERSWIEERDGVMLRRFRVRTREGEVLDISRPETGGDWRIEG